MAKKLINSPISLLWSFIVGLHVLLLSVIQFFPYPEFFVYPYLTKIGLVPYRDILDQHFPGLMFFPINFATMGIDSVFEFRMLHLLLVIASHVALFLIAKLLFKRKASIYILAILYVVWQAYFEGYTLWIESLLTPILLFACYTLLRGLKEKKAKLLFINGLLLGVALVSKQVVAPLVGLLGIFFALNKAARSFIITWCVGIAVPVFILGVFVFARRIETDFFFWTVTFNLEAFHDMGRKYATGRELVMTALITFPAMFSSFFLLKKKTEERNVLVVTTFFFAAFAYFYARFDYVHVQPLIPFALILLVLLADQFTRFKAVVIVFVIFSLFVGMRFVVRHQGNSVKFFDPHDKAVFEAVDVLTNAGDTTFAYATYPHLYAMTNTTPPGNVFVFQFPWFMKVAEDRVYEGLVNDPPKVVVRDQSATTDGYTLTEYMPKIDEFIERYYTPVMTVGPTEILKQNENSN